MLSMKKCTCGASTFKLLVDIKLVVACASCGTVFAEVDELPEVQLHNTLFKLGPA